MDKLKIRYSSHANDRCTDRDITHTQISHVLHNPADTLNDHERGNFKSYALIDNPPFISQPYLLVIYTKENTNIMVITTMWQDKGGLRAHGFSKI